MEPAGDAREIAEVRGGVTHLDDERARAGDDEDVAVKRGQRRGEANAGCLRRRTRASRRALATTMRPSVTMTNADNRRTARVLPVLVSGSIHSMAPSRAPWVSSTNAHAAKPNAAERTARMNGTVSANVRSVSVPCAVDASSSFTLLTFCSTWVGIR